MSIQLTLCNWSEKQPLPQLETLGNNATFEQNYKNAKYNLTANINITANVKGNAS